MTLQASSLGLFSAFLDPEDAATTALVAYLRSEADLADQRSRSLRTQADQLAAVYDISDTTMERYGGLLQTNELPPLDEHGFPKYRGRKRGRKPKPRQRKSKPDRPKRQHTAYTLFVSEVYPSVKAQNQGRPSKDLIAIVAKEWASLPDNEKLTWKDRALKTHRAADEDEEEEEEEDNNDEENNDDEDEEEQEKNEKESEELLDDDSVSNSSRQDKLG
jgi:hypothetical protein